MTHRRRANAFTDGNPFAGGGAENDYSNPQGFPGERKQPVTTRPRGGEVDRGTGLEVEVDDDLDDEGSDNDMGIGNMARRLAPTRQNGQRMSRTITEGDRQRRLAAGDNCPWCGLWGCSPDCPGPPAGTTCPYCGGGAALSEDGTVSCQMCLTGEYTPSGPASLYPTFGARQRRQATTIRPASPNFSSPKSCYVGGCSGTATFEVWNSGEPDKYACDDHVGSLAGDLAKQEREKLGRDRWASRRAFRDYTDLNPKPQVGNNPDFVMPHPRGEDRFNGRAGQNYDTYWRGERDAPYYEPLDPVYPRPGDERENVDEYEESTGVEPAPKQGPQAEGRRTRASKDLTHCANCGNASDALWHRYGQLRCFACASAPDAYPDVANGEVQSHVSEWHSLRSQGAKDPDDQYDLCKKCDGVGDDCSACFGLGIDPMPKKSSNMPAQVVPSDLPSGAAEVKAGDLVAGDAVLSPDGTATVVTEVKDFGPTNTVILDFEGGGWSSVTPDTVLYVQRSASKAGHCNGCGRMFSNSDTRTVVYTGGLKGEWCHSCAKREDVGNRWDKVSIRCASCGQQGKIALTKVSAKTKCRCGSPYIDFTDRIAKAQRRANQQFEPGDRVVFTNWNGAEAEYTVVRDPGGPHVILDYDGNHIPQPRQQVRKTSRRSLKAQRRAGGKTRKWYVIDGSVGGSQTVLGPYGSREAAEGVIEAGGTAWDGLSPAARVKSLWTDEGGNIHGDPTSIFGNRKANWGLYSDTYPGTEADPVQRAINDAYAALNEGDWETAAGLIDRALANTERESHLVPLQKALHAIDGGNDTAALSALRLVVTSERKTAGYAVYDANDGDIKVTRTFADPDDAQQARVEWLDANPDKDPSWVYVGGTAPGYDRMGE